MTSDRPPNCIKTRVILAGEQPIVLHGVSALLEETNRFEVIAEYTNGADALRGIVRDHPDIAILDIDTPGLRGIDVDRLKSVGTRAILLCSALTKRDLPDANKSKVAGVLIKDDALDELLSYIDIVASGGSYKRRLNEDAVEEPVGPIPGIYFTIRELQVVELAATGLSNKQIARRLSLSEGTVKIHMHHIFGKAGLTNRTELANLANTRNHAGIHLASPLPRPVRESEIKSTLIP